MITFLIELSILLFHFEILSISDASTLLCLSRLYIPADRSSSPLMEFNWLGEGRGKLGERRGRLGEGKVRGGERVASPESFIPGGSTLRLNPLRFASHFERNSTPLYTYN